MAMKCSNRVLWCWLGFLTLGGVQAAVAADFAKAAARVDSLLAKELYGATATVAPQPTAAVDDATFLRRISLDLTGELPTPEELTTFSLDPAIDKRTKAVERLLAKKEFGQNWARYWRDVIFYRRKEDRALLSAPALVDYLTEQFNKGTSWDRIARDFITATGAVTEQGSTAIIFAQMADPADTTAEVSRIFLGIQIQCAQCHNHPTDRWKREQFHELAAFFPRIGIRPDKSGARPSFSVVSFDKPRGKRAPGATEPATLEHYMPDLKDPKAKGTLMQPVFFATGQKLELGLTDVQRRGRLADWMTGSGDRWFAKAYVNRIWSELVGKGFFDPVDDMGPDRKPIAPQTFEYLASQFVASGHDVKWLFKVITATEAYQRQGRSRKDSGAAPYAAGCPQRLRADQLYNALTTALGIDESQVAPTANGPNLKNLKNQARNNPRFRMNLTFGYDPSLRREEVGGSIPQALFLMNSPELNRAINGHPPAGSLGKLLAQVSDNEAVTVELYLRCLAREPKKQELASCLAHVRSAGERIAGFEDVLWALINSTEFLHRR